MTFIIQAGKKQKLKYTYKTVEELKKSGVGKKRKTNENKVSKVKVIDMTRPEKRVLAGYGAIGKQMLNSTGRVWCNRKANA